MSETPVATIPDDWPMERARKIGEALVRHAEGETVAKIAQSQGWAASSLRNWLSCDAIKAAYARARELHNDAKVDKIGDVAELVLDGFFDTDRAALWHKMTLARISIRQAGTALPPAMVSALAKTGADDGDRQVAADTVERMRLGRQRAREGAAPIDEEAGA